MLGNVWEWVLDQYNSSYASVLSGGETLHGSPVYTEVTSNSWGVNGVFRGGFSWSSKVLYVRGGYRYGASMRSELGTALGFRLALSPA